MDEDFEFFLETFPKTDVHGDLSDSDRIKLTDILPNNMLDFLNAVGWAGFGDGIVWINNPAELQPAVDAWLAHCSAAKNDEYIAIARSAFGDMFLWSRKSGANIIVRPHYSLIITSPPEPEVSAGMSDLAIGVFFSLKKPSSFDFDDISEKPLFRRALKKLGKLAPDEMYGFEPALAIGGAAKIENLVKVKLVEQLNLLAQLAEVEVLNMDVSRHIQ